MKRTFDAKKACLFQIERANKTQFKRFLEILERIEKDHYDSMSRVAEKLPDEYVKYLYLADHLTENKMNALRKEVLTIGNDCFRTIQEELKTFDIEME